MNIRHRIAFKLRPYGKAKNLFQIQLHVTFNGDRLIVSTGCQIDNSDGWNSEDQLVIKGYEGPRGETANSINDILRNCRDKMETTFKYFEVNEIMPTKAQVAEKYQVKMLGFIPRKIDTTKPIQQPLTFFEVFRKFTEECGEKNAWTNSTFEKMESLKDDLMTFNEKLTFPDLDESGLTAFVRYLREEKTLRTPRKKKGDRKNYDHDDIIGLKNSTISKKLGYLKWFLKWATDSGFNTNTTYKVFKPTLKETQKKVIYLTKRELELIKELEIPSGTPHLEQIRDVFLFCCFSGLRHSDVYNLRRNDIRNGCIEVTTVKTADSISIELNTITRDILDKYKDFQFKDNKALPVIQNQPMNRELKELCRLAGINEEIRITTYKGNQRNDEIKEKWKLVGTHTGRRTFIVNCLSLGIPPNIVMKWTGHSDYKAMKPYIDIVDSIKASEMTKLDNLF